MGCYGCGSEEGSEFKLCPECIQKKQQDIQRYRKKGVKRLLKKYEEAHPLKRKKYAVLTIVLLTLGIISLIAVDYYLRVEKGVGIFKVAAPQPPGGKAGPVALVTAEPSATPVSLCPVGSAKKRPGICGCEAEDVDSDNDGVMDCVDLCPNDPAKADPGWCGCGVRDEDSDKDGAVDCKDLCPKDPKKTVLGLCGCGRPDSDSDEDSVPDCIDNCPFIPNPLQVDKNQNGIGDTCENQNSMNGSICLKGLRANQGVQSIPYFQFSIPQKKSVTLLLSLLDNATISVDVRIYKLRNKEPLYNQQQDIPASIPLPRWEAGVYELGFFDSPNSSLAEFAEGRFCMRLLDENNIALPVRVVMQEQSTPK